MRADFLAAVVDALLPGENAPRASALPSGTAAGVRLNAEDRGRAEVLSRIASRAGGEAAFVGASAARRTLMMREVEKQCFDAFRALVACLLEDYYEAPAVLAALGWRAAGAQPQGHAVEEADAVTLARLGKVRARRPFWRRVG
jgi:hypothetical protein